jgi:hypothetical protein
MPSGVVSEAASVARIRDVLLAEAAAQQQQVGDDAFGKLVQHHAGGGQRAGEHAHAERDRVDEAVDEGMKADAEHRHQPDAVGAVRRAARRRRR